MSEIKNLAVAGDFEAIVNGLQFNMEFRADKSTGAVRRIENGQILSSEGEWLGSFHASDGSSPDLYLNQIPLEKQAEILPALSEALTSLSEELKSNE